MNARRRRALQAVLSALAGGGVTAAALGAPFVGGALAAQSATTTTEETTTSTAPPTSSGATETTPAPATTPTTNPAAPAPSAPATTTGTTTTTLPAPPPPRQERPKVVLKRRQRTTSGKTRNQTTTKAATGQKGAPKEAAGSNVALSPQAIAAQAAALASTEASVQALGFYRIPLFLLPIYKAAAVQYGVPWQILAAINEIETNYGTDLSVSSAGAVGWMQFMPATWLQYGVDALNAGYADPYNPVDAVFAAARYLRAAGASTNLQAAILAYNHSQEYVSSVLLRAKLISAYPRSVIASLTGLVDGRLPVAGGHVSWGPVTALPPSTSATAHATQVHPKPAAAPSPSAAAAGTATAVSPAAAAARAAAAMHPLQVVTLSTDPGAKVVAVQNGRVAHIGKSQQLGRYLVLRDVYGDVFTYAGMGSIAKSYTAPSRARTRPGAAIARAASTHDPRPSQAASAGFQSPLTLQVKAPKKSHGGGQASTPESVEGLQPGQGKVRLFAHPGNPDARAAAEAAAVARRQAANAGTRVPLRAGTVVPAGTVLGTVDTPSGATHGRLRFAVQPSGDPASVDPGPVLGNWAQLQAALHPQGARAEDALLGATAADVFLLTKSELQRTVLSDPGITVTGCARHDISSGAVDRRVLAVLSFLSRSGLAPTVGSLRCGQSPVAPGGGPSAAYRGDAVEISAFNGTTVAGHQGSGTVADLAIRTLLTLPPEFLPASIVSLMRYPGAPTTHANRAYWNRVLVEFNAPSKALSGAALVAGAGKGHAAKVAVPLLQTGALSASQWDQLVGRIGALPSPTVARKPSSSAIADTKGH
jgi:membrane-bound lytic murein transglycosylase B